MGTEEKTIRIGATVLILACFFRFFGGGYIKDWNAFTQEPSLGSVLLYLGTGRVFHSAEPEAATAPGEESPVEVPTEPLSFTAEDASYVFVTNHPGYAIDVEAMLQQPLAWDLTLGEPTVLIVHSHTSESYQNTEGYPETVPYRTLDCQYNMVSIGTYLAQALEAKGICVLHDTTVHDYPSYNNAYTLSRATVQKHLQAHPSIQLVLDIHRDAYEDSSGNQIRNTVTVDGISTSRLMLVAGTNAYAEGHTQWADNLSMAVKLQAVLEKEYPGLCRPLCLRSSAFNQDLSPGALLIEVGTAGDTRQDALAAVTFLAEGIARLCNGCV